MSHHDSIPEVPANGPAAFGGGSPFLAFAGILFVILILVFGALLLGHTSSPTEEEDASRAAVRLKNLSDLQASDVAVLNGSHGGNVPIDKAMELIIPLLNAKSASVTTEPSSQKQP